MYKPRRTISVLESCEFETEVCKVFCVCDEDAASVVPIQIRQPAFAVQPNAARNLRLCEARRNGGFVLHSFPEAPVPVGVKLVGHFSTGGWTIVSTVEAAYVRSMRDTEAEDLRFLPRDALRGSIGERRRKACGRTSSPMSGRRGRTSTAAIRSM